MRPKTNQTRKNGTIRLSLGAAWCLLLLVNCFIGQKSITEAQTIAEKRYKPELVVQTGHTRYVEEAVFSPDGKTLISKDSDKVIYWDVETGQQVKSFTEFSFDAFSPDGKTFVSAPGSGIELRDAETGQVIKSWETYDSNIIIFSPDGKILASAGCQENENDALDCVKADIELWNAETGEKIKTLLGQTNLVSTMTFSPDGKILASGSCLNDKKDSGEGKTSRCLKGEIKLWSIESGQEIKTLTDLTDSTESISFSPDGKILASGGCREETEDSGCVIGGIKLWDIETGKEIKSFAVQNSEVSSVAFSPDGKLLSSLGSEGIKLWNVETSQLINALEGYVFAVFSPDGKTLAFGDGNTIKLCDVKAGWKTKTLEGRIGDVWSVTFSPDGKTLAEGRLDQTIKLWSIESQQYISLTKINKWASGFLIDSTAFSPNGKTLASGDGKNVKIWDVENGQLIKTLNGHTKSVDSVRFSPDGKTLASGSWDRTIKLWNVETGDQLKTFQGHTGLVRSVAFSPGGKTLASGSGDGTIKLWNVETGQLIKTLNKGSGVRSIAFSPDGKILASGSGDSRAPVKLWGVETGQQIKSFKGHTSLVYSVVFSPDGKTLASGSWDRTIKLWDVETGQQIKSFEGHTSWVNSAVFSPDGKTLASGSRDGTIKLWDLASGKLLSTMTSIARNDWAVTTPDGRFDASSEALRLINFVVKVPSGYEIIALEQLKSRSLTPGLLRDVYAQTRASGTNEFSITLYPEVEIEQPNQSANLLNLKLKNRGGGIGRVEVKLNGSEIFADARVGKNVNPKAASADLALEIPSEKLRGGENKVEIIVWNLENDVRSRAKEVFINVNGQGAVSKGTGVYKLEEQKKPSEINFYAIVAGVSDYAGDALDLRYAAKDSEDIANAVSRAARRYFCSDEMAQKKPCSRVHLRLLSTEKDQKAQFAGLSDVADFKRLDPNKQNFKDVFAEVAAKAKPEDVVFVYMSGHGTAIKSIEAKQESSFYDLYLYPTMDADTLNGDILGNLSRREPITVTSLEFAKWVFDIKSEKKVMIFDTCAAGAAQKDLMAMVRSDTDEDKLQIRSLDRLRERTGFYVLMGSASDKVSYEANEFRQGLLTYSLIEAMTVDTVLDDGRFLDIEKWFGYAENKVEDLAKGIGGVQKPYFFKGESKTFAVGRIESDERKFIKPASKVPLILQPELRENGKFTDKERLTDQLEKRLLELSIVTGRGEGVLLNYVKATNAANGFSPRGFYTVNTDGTITAEISLIRDETEISKFKITARKEEIIEVLIKEIIKAAQSGK